MENIAPLLESLQEKHSFLKSRFECSFSYSHPLRSQQNEISDDLIDRGIVSREGELLRQPSVGPFFVHAQVANIAWPYKLMGAFEHVKGLTLARLLTSALRAFDEGDFVVACVCLRSALEHIAHFYSAKMDAERLELGANKSERLKSLFAYHASLLQTVYGTRTDWLAAITTEPSQWKKPFEYRSETGRIDIQAKSIMGKLDKLEKSVSGSRAVYELLCEFAHPSTGTMFSFSRENHRYEDRNGVVWVEREFSPGNPSAFVHEAHTALKGIFETVDRCLQVFLDDLGEWAMQKEKVFRLTQSVIHEAITAYPEYFEPYELCPCGSGEKTKFCSKDR